MTPLLIGLGLVTALLVIYVIVRLTTRKAKRQFRTYADPTYPRSSGTLSRSRGGSTGSTGSTGSDPAYDPGVHYYSFSSPDSSPSHHHHDHASNHYTPEAPSSYGGDIGSVDSSSGGCDGGGGGSD